jgi:glutamate/tyrosine decarboxylase-like PLP-dependent enzyme
MMADTLIPAQVGFLAAMLYNPNNVASEGSPVTSALEREVARDLAELMGFDPDRAWGHLCSGGTVANIEALWILRNLALAPLRLPRGKHTGEWKDAAGRILTVKMPDQLLGRLRTETLLAMHRTLPPNPCTVRRGGAFRVLVPATAHYSWNKAANLLGIGEDQLLPVPVDASLRLDLGALEQMLDRLAKENHPVLAVVGIVGTTEGGGVDPVDGLLELRERHAKAHGRWFFIHLDAAYGGYARALFRRTDGSFREVGDPDLVCPMRKEVHAAFQAMSRAESITIDPHKLGFIPYPAGALVLREGDMRTLTTQHAAYLNPGEEDHLGSYILEGSKPGAAASAVWLAHRTVPLNEGGYGAILSESFRSARGLAELLDGRQFGDYGCHVFDSPDLDVLLYAFAPRKVNTLHRVNALNEEVLARFRTDRAGDFSLASTQLSHRVHGHAPLPFLARLGVPAKDWRNQSHLLVLRSVMMTPFIADARAKAFYRQELLRALESLLGPSEMPETTDANHQTATSSR